MSSSEPETNNVPDGGLGYSIHIARKDARLSLRELARRADVPPSQLSRIESGEIQRPSSDALFAIARAFGKPPEPLLYLAGHLSDEEFDDLASGWQARMEEIRTALEVYEGFREDGRRDVAAEGMFAGPGVAEIAGSVLTMADRQEVRGLRDLTAMWQSLTPERRKALLSFASDQERLSILDRRGSGQGRYRVTTELEEQ